MNRQAEDKYADIINLPHHASWKNVKITLEKHQKM